MAANPPDPRSLASWDDAFQYPIVAVRGMEKKLRRDIDENHEKLRTLVGYVASVKIPPTVLSLSAKPTNAPGLLKSQLS